MRSAVFLAPKRERGSLESAEDRGGLRVDGAAGGARLVVADGASTSHLSGLFAELIVSSFVDDLPFGPGDNAAFGRWTGAISEDWNRAAVEATGEQWYAQESLERGSAAAFAAAVVDGRSCWCVAVGDCCLFHVRADPSVRCVASFPIVSGRSFTPSPPLLRTDASKQPPWPTWTRLDVRSGDFVLGASDGFAEWVLGGAVEHPDVWELLVQIDADGFGMLVGGERERGAMVDDDAVLVRLMLGESG